MEVNQDWFEMPDLRKRKLDNSVWIPLRSEKEIRNNIDFGFVGYQEEFIGSGSLMIPNKKKSYSKNLTWMDIGIIKIHDCSFEDDEYIASDTYAKNDFRGINLVLNQSFDNNYDISEWHLHQDLVISLGLKRELDVWVCPKEGYIEAAKLERDDRGRPVSLLIRNQFLKDYLCARDSGLYVSSYYSRNNILEDVSFLSWNENYKKVKKGKDVWEGGVSEIHEGRGFPFGQKIAVSRAARTDVFDNEDIPDISKFPTDKDIEAEFSERGFNGRKLYRVMSELWKYDWINSAKKSSIILGQSDGVKIYFIIDAEGTKKSADTLVKGGKWLWFKPELVPTLLSKRGSFLNWYSRDTGQVSCAPNGGIHFGINDLGFITVYAKDIGYLPTWQQQIWAGFNIPPEGGISKELHASQVRADPASTLAPESFIESVINDLNKESFEKLGIKIFREHHSIKEIISTINRFRAIDDKGLYSLAKDIARIIVDDINTEELQKIVTPPKGMKWGSLKTIENFLAQKIKPDVARSILSPLVGVYELRHGDAHLPGRNIEEAFQLIGIDRSLPTVLQGHQMLYSCVDHLHVILSVIREWDIH